MMRSLALIALLLVGCDGDESIARPEVTVLRLDRSPGCYQQLSDKGYSEQIVLDREQCGVGEKLLVGGVDQIYVVIDYGEDVHFTETATIPPPIVKLSIDGSPSTVAINISPPRRGEDERVYFLANFRTPSIVSRNVVLSVTVTDSFAATVPTTFQIGPATPRVAVLRYKHSATPCYDNLTPSVGVTDEQLPICATADASTGLIAGIDQLAVVIDFGSLSFDSPSTAPRPTIVMAVDEQQVTVQLTISPPRSLANGTIYFVATFIAPTQVGQKVTIEARSATDGGFSVPASSSFSLVRAKPAAALLAYVAAQECYFDLSTTTTMPIDLAALGLVACSGTEPTSVVAGVDRLVALVDYGPSIRFALPTVVATPSISLVLDGITSMATIAAGQPLSTSSGRIYFLSSFTAPSPAMNVALHVAVTGGFAESAPSTISIVRPTLSVTIAECATVGCTITANVGAVTITVRAPGPQQRQVVFRTYLDNVLQSNAPPPQTTTQLGDTSELVVAIPVPRGTEGQQWLVEAVLDGVPTRAPTITLREPTIESRLGCSTPCTVAAGGSLALTVTAPDGIHAVQALVSQRLSNAPFGATSPINLVVRDVTAKTIRGTLTFDAPTTPGVWSFEVSVDGYFAETVTATVTP